MRDCRCRVPPPAPSVSSACVLILPICAYITAAWSHDGQMLNDYITSAQHLSNKLLSRRLAATPFSCPKYLVNIVQLEVEILRYA